MINGPAHGVQRGLRDSLEVLDAGAVLDQHHELVAAHPGHQVTVTAQVGAQALGDGPQQRVAGVVAQGVVDGLEVVQVQVADPDRVVRGRRRSRAASSRSKNSVRLGSPVSGSCMAWCASRVCRWWRSVMFSTIATTNRGLPCGSRTRDSTRWVQISSPSLR